LDALLKKIAEATIMLLECERASIFLHEPGSNELWTPVALQAGTLRVPAAAGIVGAAFTGNQVIVVESAQDDPRFHRDIDRTTGYTTRSLLAAPMLDIESKPVGVIEAINRREGTFTQAHVPLIQLLADQAGVAVQRHQLQMKAITAAALRHEMELARDVQQSMLPKKAPQVPGMEVGVWAATASLTGGDAYDLWAMPGGGLGFFLADGAGHGLAPALVVSQVRTLIRALAEENPHADPDHLLGQVNRRISQDFQPMQFVTAFLAFARCDGVLQWSSAGHGPVYLSKGKGGPFEELEPPHQPLGVSDEWQVSSPKPVELSAGAMLIAPSDGMFEASNSGGDQFTAERLMAVATANRDRPVEQLVDRMRLAVQAWQEGPDGADDQTLAVLRWGTRQN
jgi:phosphoserine phosphatase RsbU/P